MKISTKGRYGLRALLDLAINSREGQVSLASIANRQNISVNYLEQVFSVMRRAGLVKSIKGFQGGYILAMAPEEITIDQVITALEGNFRIVDDSIFNSMTDDPIRAVVKELVWDRINEQVSQYTMKTTLQDLCQEYENRQANIINMYYI